MKFTSPGRILIVLLVVAFTNITNAFEVKCMSNAKLGMKAVGVKSSDVDIITNNDCDDPESFMVTFRALKELKVAGIKIEKGTAISVSSNRLNGFYREDNEPIVISNEISCLRTTTFEGKPPTLCQCLLAKPFKVDGIDIPIGVEARFDIKHKLENFLVTKDNLTIQGQDVKAGKIYVIKNKKIEVLSGEDTSRCSTP